MGDRNGKRITKNRLIRRRKKGKEKTPSNRLLPRLFIHPLFLILGAYYLFKGEVWLFFSSAIVALQHEYAHAIVAAKSGLRLNRVVLMPYGAVLDGETDGVPLLDEIKIALAGPFCNLLTALFFLAVWWLFPSLYAFTDTAFFASLSIALVNLLPAYPLDGGRVLFCLLRRAFLKNGLSPKDSEKRAKLVCRITAILIAVSLFTLFVFGGINGQKNYTLFAFSLFTLLGAFGNGKKAEYQPFLPAFQCNLEQGAEIRKVAVSSATSIKRAVCFLERGRYLILAVYESGTPLGELTQDDLIDGLKDKSFYSPLSSFFVKK